MSVQILVFEDREERCMKLANYSHDWKNQKRIFGTETEKLLELCDKLFHTVLRNEKEEQAKLLKKIWGIAKAHGLYVVWYGTGGGACEPDRFLVYKHRKEVAFIQC